MKNSVSIIAFLILLSVPLVTCAQREALLDSVQFRMNAHLSMEIICDDYYHRDWGNVDSLFSLFLTDFKKIEDEILDRQKTNHFSYLIDGPYRKIKVNNQSTVTNEMSFDENGSVLYFQVVEFHLGGSNQIVFKSPSIDGFSAFEKMKLNQLIQTSVEEIFPEGRGKNQHVSSVLFVDNGRIITEKTISDGRSMDTIELMWGVGLGTVRSTLTPDIEGKLLVNLTKKGLDRYQMGVSFESLFSFHSNGEGNLDVRTNSFLSLIIARSVYMRESGITRMWGVKLGGTVIQDDHTFDGTAYKIGFYYEMGNRITLEPAFLFENDFKTSFPIVRVAITL